MEKHLADLIARRAAVEAEITALKEARKAITEAAEARAEGERDLTEDEATDFRAKRDEIKTAQERFDVLDNDVRELEAEIVRSGRQDVRVSEIARAKVTAVTEVREPLTYQRHNGASYFQDIANFQLQRADAATQERLARHSKDVDSNKELRKVAMVGDEYRNLDRNDGSGGFFVPPLWVMNEFIPLARAGRTYANLVKSKPLPPGTDSISVPKVLTGTSTGIQTGDNVKLTEVDLTDTSISAPVRTIGGLQGVSLQALEQSPIAFDDLIFADLAADYAVKLDRQVISGTGTAGQVVGVRATNGIVTIAATDATTELAKAQAVYKKIGDAIQRVHTSRFLSPDVIVMHPRRWQAFLTLFAADGRLAIVPDGAGLNQLGLFERIAPENLVGRMQGLPVAIDSNLPTTLGTGTNEDVVHVLRSSDLNLYESSVRSQVFTETRAEGLTVLLRVHGYLAFTAARYPQSVVEIGGTALTAPTFA